MIKEEATAKATTVKLGLPPHLCFKHSTHGESALEWDAIEMFASALEELASATAPLDVRQELLSLAHLAVANTGILAAGVGLGPGQQRGMPGHIELFGWETGAGSIIPVATCELMCRTVGGEADVTGVRPVSASRVLDFLPVKLEGLRKAVETACSVLRVKSVVL